MAKGTDEAAQGLEEKAVSGAPIEETEALDPEFEAALTVALALEATERIERLGQLASALKEDLDSSC
ncbi:hypothetical protein E4U03_12015 [Rothia nasimurium]|uniref:GTPase n=1 Tax=Rothia nasimurium TaxID=85336 RepID=A0A4Y9F1R2_9MICC|nr:hypothetical protein [Rothia nasimurium]MBF0809322.1 hypothetical protein [Rothia nasimurium]TFU19974.1 hypothetical protein E4U03_12015 [Rothia nasimurium]